jgi:hypothetical protein
MENPNLQTSCSSHLSEESVSDKAPFMPSVSERDTLEAIERMNQQSRMATLHQLDQIQALIRAG